MTVAEVKLQQISFEVKREGDRVYPTFFISYISLSRNVKIFSASSQQGFQYSK